MRYTPLFAALVALVMGPALAQGGLPRLPLAYNSAFDAIGRLGDGSFEDQGCTGVLIAPDLVLTAGHCLQGSGAGGAIFAAGWRSNAETARATVVRSLRHPDYAFQTGKVPEHDIGLAFLAAPLEGITPLPLAEAPARDWAGRSVALLGYHAGAPGGMSGGFECPLSAGPEGKVALQCPVRGGNSGSPILAKQGNGWQIIAVATSRLGQQGAIAMELGPWLRAQVTAHLSEP